MSFFISYNGGDKTWAEWIAWTLEDAGYHTVIQAWDFRPGADFVLEMQRAASGTERTIAVLSENYLNAEYTQPEWANAFARDPQGRERTLLPVRIAPCHPAGLLATRIYLDLVGLGEEEARNALLLALQDRVKPAAPPVYPGSNEEEKQTAAWPTPAEITRQSYPGATSTAVEVWREKLQFLRGQEPFIVDAAQKFALQKQIEEAKAKIAEQGGQPDRRVAFIQSLDEAKPLKDLISANKGAKSVTDGNPISSSTPSGAPTLPQLSPWFVGREDELREIRSALIDSRILQVRGLGGIGKSELALAVAHQVSDLFPDGIIWLFAPDVTTLELFITKMAVQFRSAIPPQTPLEARTEYIKQALAQNKVLLILDNLEDARIAEDIVAFAPNLSVLVTSRPRIPIVRKSVCIDLDVLSTLHAIDLFVQVSGIELPDGETQEKLESLCQNTLGNFPLAIELAAKLLRFAFSDLDKLNERLMISLDDLDDVPEFIDARKVKASFLSTYQVLTTNEKQLFDMLGVFPGCTFSLEAIKAVADPLAGETIESTLHKKLVALSLVKIANGRYSLHQLLKSFASSHLGSSAPYARMARYFADYAKHNASNVDALETERANLLGAIDWSAENAEYELVIELVEALVSKLRFFSFLSQRGYWNEAVLRLDQELTALQQTGKPRGRVYLSLGFFHYLLGNNDNARECHKIAIKEFKQTDDVRRLILTYWQCGYIEDDEDNYDEALAFYEESLALAEKGFPNFILNSRKLVGVVKYHQGDYSGARSNIEQSLEEAVASNNKGDITTCQRRLAAVFRRQAVLHPDELDRNSLIERSRQLLLNCLQREKHKRSVARTLRQMGMLEQTAKNIPQAKDYFERSLTIFKNIVNKKGIASVLYNLGTILEHEGDLEGAEKNYNESLKLARGLRLRLGAALNMRQLGLVKHQHGESQEALHLMTEAVAILEKIKSPYLQETRDRLEELEAELEEKKFRELYDRLWQDAMRQFETGHVETDPDILNIHNDRRLGFTLIARPPQEIIDKFTALVQTLKEIDGNQYFYMPDQFHITILTLITATEDFPSFSDKIPQYRQVLEAVLSGKECFDLVFRGITASRNCIMVQGFAQTALLNQLRDELRDTLREMGLGNGVDTRYRITTAHSTIMRFQKQPRHLGLLQNTIASLRKHYFGRATIRTLQWVTNDWYMSSDRVTILQEYHLQEGF